MKDPTAISARVLIVGPAFNNYRGGIGAVLKTYSTSNKDLKFLITYNYKGYHLIFFYLYALFNLVFLLLFDWKISIVHIHSASRGSFFRKSIVVIISKLFRKKVIFHIHGAEFHLFYDSASILKLYIRTILKVSDKIVCLSPQWESYFSLLVSPSKIEVINNPVESHEFKREVRNTQEVKLLFLGRVGERKGVFDLVNAIKLLPEHSRRNIQLIIAGDGEIDRLIAVIKESNLEDTISYKGWVIGENKISLLKESNIFILPSYNEGLPVSILEAMSYGLAIISTPVGGIPEVVKSGVNGILIKPGDLNAIAEAINSFINNTTLLKLYGNQSLDLVKPFLSIEVINRLQNLYSSLLKNENA